MADKDPDVMNVDATTGRTPEDTAAAPTEPTPPADGPTDSDIELKRILNEPLDSEEVGSPLSLVSTPRVDGKSVPN